MTEAERINGIENKIKDIENVLKMQDGLNKSIAESTSVLNSSLKEATELLKELIGKINVMEQRLNEAE